VIAPRSAARVPPALVVLLLAAACRGQAVPAPGALSPPRPPVLGEATCERPRLKVEVLEVVRTSPEVLSVKLLLSNLDATAPAVIGNAFADEGAPGDGSLSGAFLLDEAGGKKVFVLRDAQGQPRCSTGLDRVPAGGRIEAWARYPVPRPDVARVALHLPGVPLIRGLAVAGGDGTARPSPSY
jgi:hypothetical protein